MPKYRYGKTKRRLDLREWDLGEKKDDTHQEGNRSDITSNQITVGQIRLLRRSSESQRGTEVSSRPECLRLSAER
jgi:hypothetical protein